MEHKRLFLAVRPPEEICRRIAAIARAALLDPAENAKLPAPPAPVRLLPTPNLHITLLFLGDTPVNRITDIEQAVAPHAARRRQFELELTRFGCFPSTQKPRVVWVGVDDAAEILTGLHKDICGELRQAAFALETRPFRAHITVGYVKRAAHRPAAAVRAFLNQANRLLAAEPSRFPVRGVSLIASELTSSGALHRGLWSADLPNPANGDGAAGSA